MTSHSNGRSLELFFINGQPDKMVTAEVFNWTGHVLMAPRTQIADVLKREEAGRTGVYLLIGEEEGAAMAYIGEAEEVGKRVGQHASSKDWWDKAILITAAGDGLHKAHVKYLESRLIEIATKIGGTKLENGNHPAGSSLSEAHVANMEAFIDTLQIVLPALRVDIFVDRKRISNVDEGGPKVVAPTFELRSSKIGLHAVARLIEGEFVVQKGSSARRDWIGDRSERTSYWRLHDDLVAKGVLVDDGEIRQFTSDYAFSSSSAAGAVVTGRSTRGPIAWKLVGTSKSYGDWEAEQLAVPEANS